MTQCTSPGMSKSFPLPTTARFPHCAASALQVTMPWCGCGAPRAGSGWMAKLQLQQIPDAEAYGRETQEDRRSALRVGSVGQTRHLQGFSPTPALLVASDSGNLICSD